MSSFQKMIEDLGYETRSYSGRVMFGKKCLGITLDRDQSMGELMGDIMNSFAGHAAKGSTYKLADALEVAAKAFRDMRTDSMGLGTIVYFPGILFDDTDEDDSAE
jgi:hypothetical protein